MRTAERTSYFRAYFEKGCACILEAKIEKQNSDVSDVEALNYYKANCKCSRNYNSLDQGDD